MEGLNKKKITDFSREIFLSFLKNKREKYIQ